MKNLSLIFLIYVLFIFGLSSQKKSVELSFIYTGDNLMNTTGGVSTGYGYVGLAHLQLDIGTEQIGLWKNGSFFINLSNSHGREASTDLIGDFQVVSGIEAGNHLFFQDLWLFQEFTNFEFTLGIQELNVETSHVELGELFAHSSFGVTPILSANFDGPIYPHTSLGLTTKWFINKNLTWLNAFYAGKAADRDKYIYNINWTFKPGSGQLLISEIQHKIQVNQLSGIYKAGIFSNNHVLERALYRQFADSLDRSVHGAYASYEQTLWKQEEKQLCAFIQLGVSPFQNSMNKLYVGGAVIGKGLLTKNRHDELGLGGAYAGLERGAGHESFIELTWKKPLGDHS